MIFIVLVSFTEIFVFFCFQLSRELWVQNLRLLKVCIKLFNYQLSEHTNNYFYNNKTCINQLVKRWLTWLQFTPSSNKNTFEFEIDKLFSIEFINNRITLGFTFPNNNYLLYCINNSKQTLYFNLKLNK